MRVPMKWLSRYVDVSGYTAEDIQRLLTSRGLEVEGIEKMGGEIDKVVVGRLESVVPHPDSDHMLICQVDVGGRNSSRSLTGAPISRRGTMCRWPSMAPACRAG